MLKYTAPLSLVLLAATIAPAFCDVIPSGVDPKNYHRVTPPWLTETKSTTPVAPPAVPADANAAKAAEAKAAEVKVPAKAKAKVKVKETAKAVKTSTATVKTATALKKK